MVEFFETFLWPNTRILLLAAAVFLLLEHLRPAHSKQKKWRKDSYLDLIYSYSLPIIIYPTTIYFSHALTDHFWANFSNINQNDSRLEMKATVLEKPRHGEVVVHSNGDVSYSLKENYVGLDHFVVVKVFGENSLTQSYLAQVQTGLKKNGPLVDKAGRPFIKLSLVDERISGKVTKGFTGFFFQIRQYLKQLDLILQLFLATFLIDFVGYWRHRLMHSKFLWPFHSIHHAPKQLDWLSNERFHPVNHQIAYVLSFTTLVLFFKDPFVLSLAMPLRHAYGMLVHSNTHFSLGPLNYLFVTPLFHRWHHSDSDTYNKNFATFFSCIDWVFGTFYLPGDKKEPATYGLPEEEIANRFWPQLIYPFLKLGRMISR